jgi:hypothetical protein
MAPPFCKKKHFGLTPHPNYRKVLQFLVDTTDDYEFTINNL